VSALEDNTMGNKNTANGVEALFHNATGNNNIALGNTADHVRSVSGENLHKN